MPLILDVTCMYFLQWMIVSLDSAREDFDFEWQ